MGGRGGQIGIFIQASFLKKRLETNEGCEILGPISRISVSRCRVQVVTHITRETCRHCVTHWSSHDLRWYHQRLTFSGRTRSCL